MSNKIKHNSLWKSTSKISKYPHLKNDIETDVCIIGGGIAGLTAAYLLKDVGKKVVVIERNKIAKGVTSKTTAKITALQYFHYQNMTKKFGKENAKTYIEANQDAIDTIARIISEEAIKCDFFRKTMYIYSPGGGKSVEKVNKEYEVLKELEQDVTLAKKLDLPFQIKAAVGLNNQAQFHPLEYLEEVAKTIDNEDSRIYESTEAKNIEEENGKVFIKTKNATITADKAVIASHYPFMDQEGFYFARLKPKRDYAIAFTTEDDLPADMYIGSGEIPYSIRTYNNMIVFAGEMHPVGHGKNMKRYYKKLINAAKNMFDIKEIKYKWSTQDNFTPDGIPYIGKLTPNSINVYVATGFNGWGMTGGTLSGMVLKDYVQGLDNPLMEIVNPFRGRLFKSGGKLIKQNLHIGKMFIKDKFGKTEVESVDDIPRGEGRIVKFEGEKVAVYKDENGKLIKLSAKCPHMGCIVNWNSAEKSWDCPCHGSRFDKNGKAIHGPSQNRLERKEKSNGFETPG